MKKFENTAKKIENIFNNHEAEMKMVNEVKVFDHHGNPAISGAYWADDMDIDFELIKYMREDKYTLNINFNNKKNHEEYDNADEALEALLETVTNYFKNNTKQKGQNTMKKNYTLTDCEKDISELQDEINFNKSCIAELPTMLDEEIKETKENYKRRIANTTSGKIIKNLTAMFYEQIEELKKLYEQREESYKEEIEKCNKAIKELEEIKDELQTEENQQQKGNNTMKTLDTFEDIMNELEATGFEISEETRMEECMDDDEDGRAEVRDIFGKFEDELNNICFKIQLVYWRQRFVYEDGMSFPSADGKEGELEDCSCSLLDIWIDNERDNEAQYQFPGDEDGHEAADELYTEIQTKIKRYY